MPRPRSLPVNALLLGCLLVTPSVAGGQTGEFRISNFAAGPLCRYDEETGSYSGDVNIHADGDICEGTDVEIRGEGRCVYAGEEKRCTWFGFEFDYENKDPDEPITCTSLRSRPADLGDIEEVRKRGAVADTFDLRLEGVRGHHWNPMYNLHAAPPAPLVVTWEFACSYRDRPVFDTTYRLIFSPRFR